MTARFFKCRRLARATDINGINNGIQSSLPPPDVGWFVLRINPAISSCNPSSLLSMNLSMIPSLFVSMIPLAAKSVTPSSSLSRSRKSGIASASVSRTELPSRLSCQPFELLSKKSVSVSVLVAVLSICPPSSRSLSPSWSESRSSRLTMPSWSTSKRKPPGGFSSVLSSWPLLSSSVRPFSTISGIPSLSLSRSIKLGIESPSESILPSALFNIPSPSSSILVRLEPVSYTHLTLPTILLV